MSKKNKTIFGLGIVGGIAATTYLLFHDTKETANINLYDVELANDNKDTTVEFHEEFLPVDDGLSLYISTTSPKTGDIKGIVQIIHGMNEHARRYQDLANFLAKNGYLVVTSDNRGHGFSIDSNNPHGHMDSYQRLVEDQVAISNYIKDKNPGLPLYLYGHSFGSLLARMYLQDNDFLIDKLLLTGTVAHFKMSKVGCFIANIADKLVGSDKSSWIIQKLAQVGGKGDDWITNDKKVLKDIKKDPLWMSTYDNSGIATIWKSNLDLKADQKYKLTNKNLPILSITGAEDIVTGGKKGLEDTKKTLEEIGYKNIEIINLPNMKHEVINELDNEKVYDLILNFFDK